MSNANSTPSEFIPFDTLIVGSNRLLGGGSIFIVEDIAPLLIGRGPAEPFVWLRVPGEPSDKQWVDIVQRNESIVPDADLVIVPATTVTVSFRSHPIVTATQTADTVLIVSQLDMRPVGFDVYIKGETLHLGQISMTRNSLAGKAMANFGRPSRTA